MADHRRSRLIGRDRPLALLREALVSAATGEARGVVVTGEAGIGKSRLLAEALAGLDGVRVLTGQAVDMATGEIPFGVLAATLRDLTRSAGLNVLTDAERVALAPLLPGSSPSSAADRVQLLSAVIDLLERLMAEQPLVWVVEDLHWADSATRDLVTLSLRTIRGPFAVVATVRTDDPDRPSEQDATLTSYVAALARIPGAFVLPLSRLTAEQVHEQLGALLGTGLPPGAAARIEQLSDGVPFVVEELAAAAGRSEVATASTVASGRLSTLAALSPEGRRVVDAVAVGDGHLRISLLEQVVDATPEELDDALADAVRAGILLTEVESDSLGFRHALLRDAADRAMGPGARRSWHRRWAEVLEANPGVFATDPAALAIAEHWHHARDARRALAATFAALPAAARICRPDEESELWIRIMRGYATLDDAPDLTGVPVREALALGYMANIAASVPQRQRFHDAVPIERLSETEGLAHRAMAMQTGKGEGFTVPQDVTDEVERAFADEAPDLLSTLVWGLMGSRSSDTRSGQALIDRAWEASAAFDNPRLLVALASVASYYAQIHGDSAKSAAVVEEVLDRLSDQTWEGVLRLRGNLIWCLLTLGELQRADTVATDALERLPHPHLSPGIWEHLSENAACTWYVSGQWQRARELLERGAPWWQDDVRSSNARLDLLDLEQLGTADVSRWPAHLDRPADEGAPRLVVRDLLAREAAARGDLVGMRRWLEPAWADELVLLGAEVLWATALFAARAEADAALVGASVDPDAAAAHVEAIARVTADFPRCGVLGEVWPVDLAAQLDRFRGRDARPALREALAGWERIGHVPDAMVTHVALAEAEALHGDRNAGRSHLARAREIATTLQARPMLAHITALADRHCLGLRERRAEDLLTEREAEVLALLAEGRTNSEIAAILFMSAKTASVHVSRIITKLGAANRTEAAAIARRQGLLPT